MRRRRLRVRSVLSLGVIAAVAYGTAAELEWPLWMAVAIAAPSLVLPVLAQWGLTRALRQGRLRRASRWARMLDKMAMGRRGLVPTLDALSALAEGQPEAAHALIDTFAASSSASAEALRDWLLAATDQWSRAANSQAADIQVRALCELGQLHEATELMARRWSTRRMTLGRLRHARWLALPPLAFAGRVRWVRALGQVLRLPAPLAEVWIATAEAAAGDAETARRRLEPIAEGEGMPLGVRALARRRLKSMPAPAAVLPETHALLDRLGPEIRAGLSFRLGRPHQSGLTLALILSMLVVFSLPLVLGWSLLEWRLSVEEWAMVVDATDLWSESPWRLVTYGWLHQGGLHLATNLCGIAVLAPIIQRLYGLWGGVAVFVSSVIGGGLCIAFFGQYGITLGASGGVMGLMGALVAVAWVRRGLVGTLTARAVASGGLMLWLAQSLFDVLMPQVSFAGHLGGAIFGALVGSIWPSKAPEIFSPPAEPASPASL
ncbi:MAG: rhomboid family intramembrane serine protease [Bradymonadia bacterium]